MPVTIAVDPKTRDRLRTFGQAGMSDDEILQHLMDSTEKNRFLEELHRTADGDSEWVELDGFDWSE